MDEFTEEGQFDLSIIISKYLNPVVEKKKVVLFFFFTGLIISLIISSLIEPEYVSEATCRIGEPTTLDTSFDRRNKKLYDPNASGQYVNMEAEKLKSFKFASEVFRILPDEAKEDFKIRLDFFSQIKNGMEKQLNNKIGEKRVEWLKKRLKKKKTTEETKQNKDDLIVEMLNRVSIKSNARSALAWITCRTINKDMAPIIVKSYIDIWIALNLENNKKTMLAKKDFADEQKINSFQEFKQAEKALVDLKIRYQIPSEIDITPDLELQNEIDRLKSVLSLVKEQYNKRNEAFQNIQTQFAGITGNIEVLNSPGTAKITEGAGKGIISKGILIGLMIGVGIALATDYVRGPIRHESDIANAVHLPLLGHIPKI